MSVRLKAVFICLVLIAVQVLTVFTVIQPKTAYAETNWGNTAAGKNLEAVFLFIEYCNAGRNQQSVSIGVGSTNVRLAGQVTTQQVDDYDIFHIYDPAGPTVYPTGGKAVPISGIWGDPDNQRECQNLTKQVAEALYGDYETFINTFYAPASGGNRVRNSTYSTDSSIVDELRSKAIEKGYYVVKDGGRYVIDPVEYRRNVLHQPFTDCFKTTTDPVTAGGDAFEFEGKIWTPKGGVLDYVIHVGPVLDRSQNMGAYITVEQANDGKWDCEEFKNLILKDPNYFRNVSKGTPDLQDENNAAARARKKQVILAALQQNSAAFTECVEKTWISPDSLFLTAMDTGLQMDAMADYLLDGDVSVGAANLDPASSSALADCLRANDAIAAALEEADAIIPETADDPSTDTGAEDESGDDCYDNVEPLFTIPITGYKVPNPLKWAVCGVAQLLGSFIDGATSVVKTLLEFNPTSDKDGGPALHDVWKQILTVANILFVIAFLIMVISTALDLGIFSNYTVKKLLPRIILGAILANLSWDICRVMIELTLVIGGAVREILLAPLSTTGLLHCGATSTEQCLQGQAGAILNANAATTGITTIAIGALIYASIASAGAILVPVLATVGIAAAVAVVVLLLRRVIIVLLIIAAPIAFVLMALPGGENLTKRWWKTFMQMLLMYPMVMALFASGIFISAIMDLSANDDPISKGVQAIVLFLPFFMLPFLFKAAGGALANVSGMINDRSKGLIDRSKNWRDKNSQYGRRKELKAQRKNYAGHEKLLKSMEADSLALGDNKTGRWLQRRRRSQGLGRNWAQGHEAKETQDMFLAKARASASKERVESDAYLLDANGRGGIDYEGVEGRPYFRITEKGKGPGGKDKVTWLKKDAAMAYGALHEGAIVEDVDHKTGQVYGRLSDGSLDARRAMLQKAAGQGLVPVMDAFRYGATADRTNWKQLKFNADGSSYEEGFDMEGISSLGGTAGTEAAGIWTEARETGKGALMPKMPSQYKGRGLAYEGMTAQSFAQMHEYEIPHVFEYYQDNQVKGANGDAQAAQSAEMAISALGQSMVEVTRDPGKYARSPKALREVAREWDKVMAANGGVAPAGVNSDMIEAMSRINRDNGSINPI